MNVESTAEKPKTEIVRATQKDVTDIIKLHKKVFKETYPSFSEAHTAEEDLAHFSEMVSSQQVYVARCGECLVGYIAFSVEKIADLYVDIDSQGQGIGTKLLNLAKTDNDLLSLWTFGENKNALKFYELHGFKVVEKTDGSQNEHKQPDLRLEWRKD